MISWKQPKESSGSDFTLKSQLSSVVRGLRHIASVPLLGRRDILARQPVVWKPRDGSGGCGVVKGLASDASRGRFCQPWLKGREFRMTLLGDRIYCAELTGRIGRLHRWRLGLSVPSNLAREFTWLSAELGLDAVGVDVLLDGSNCWLLDLNDLPCLSMVSRAA